MCRQRVCVRACIASLVCFLGRGGVSLGMGPLMGPDCRVWGCANWQYKTHFLPVMPGHVLAENNNLESAATVGLCM
jgi:hypothetical protein